MRLATILLSSFVLAACVRAPRDPAEACLREVLVSAERRDADAVLAHVSERFRDSDAGDKSDAAALVRRSLAAYASLSLKVEDLAIERGSNTAQAKFRIRMSGRPRGAAGLEGLLPRSSRWSFDVRLESEPGGWRIVSASWTRLEDVP